MTIVINSKNFDQFWQLWLILTNSNCDMAFVIGVTILKIMNNCDNYDQLWQFSKVMTFSGNCQQLWISVTIVKKCDNIDHIASRGLSLTSCQSCSYCVCVWGGGNGKWDGQTWTRGGRAQKFCGLNMYTAPNYFWFFYFNTKEACTNSPKASLRKVTSIKYVCNIFGIFDTLPPPVGILAHNLPHCTYTFGHTPPPPRE